MLPNKILGFGLSKSCIRELAAYGAKRKAEIGADQVFDFSLGNPSIPAPASEEAAKAHRAHTVSAAVWNGVSSAASGRLFICPTFSGNAVKAKVSFWLSRFQAPDFITS